MLPLFLHRIILAKKQTIFTEIARQDCDFQEKSIKRQNEY